MKKPGKPKPKRRAHKNALPPAGSRQAPADAKAKARPVVAAAPANRAKPNVRAKSAARPSAAQRHLSPGWPAGGVTLQPILLRATSARTAVLHALDTYPRDDRSALALLLLPFLVLAASLGLSQTWRYTVHALPELSMRVPYSPPARPVALAPPSAPPISVPAVPRSLDIEAPGSLAYPTSPPPVTVASLDVRGPDVAVRPPTVQDLILPGALIYPPAAPAIGRPEVANAPDFIVPGTLVYPTTPPSVAVASLDVGRPDLRPLAPATPSPDATLSPPQPSWSDRLREPPIIDIAPPSIAEAPILPPTGDICQASSAQLAGFSANSRMARKARLPLADPSNPAEYGLKLASAARAQTKDLVIYSARYHRMAYPMGDMPTFYGACTDVIIRAYRAVGLDLQELVQRTHSGRGDTNIDHRRTETLRILFAKAGASLPITRYPEDYKPGDVVTYHRPFSRVSSSHIAMVSDVLAPSGRPMIVHNRGWGPQLEDALFVDRITGHYRYTGSTQAVSAPAVAEAPAPAAPSRELVRASFPAATLVGGSRAANLALRRINRAAEPRDGATGPSAKAH